MKEINYQDFNENIFKMIGEDWLLVTAEKDGKVNTMTASWGGTGILWNKRVAYIFIRPQRYTKEFIDSNDKLSFICKKLYAQDMKEECFIEKDLIDKCYKDGDYHTMYVVEIENMLEK